MWAVKIKNSLCGPGHLSIFVSNVHQILTWNKHSVHAALRATQRAAPSYVERPQNSNSHSHILGRLTPNRNGHQGCGTAFIRVRDCNKFRLPRSPGWKTFIVVKVAFSKSLSFVASFVDQKWPRRQTQSSMFFLCRFLLLYYHSLAWFSLSTWRIQGGLNRPFEGCPILQALYLKT